MSRKTPGPKFSDIAQPEVETREYESGRMRSSMGRSSIEIKCPFCSAWFVAYLWSLAGGGKRCTCGGLFGGRGEGYHWKEEES